MPGVDGKVEDIIKFLQSPNLNETLYYSKYFQSFTYLLLDYLHEHSHDKFDHDNMKDVLRKLIKRVIAELQNHFHLSRYLYHHCNH